MGLSIVNYSTGETGPGTWGVLRDAGIYPIRTDFADHRQLMAAYFNQREEFDGAIGDTPVDADGVSFNSPVSRPFRSWISRSSSSVSPSAVTARFSRAVP